MPEPLPAVAPPPPTPVAPAVPKPPVPPAFNPGANPFAFNAPRPTGPADFSHLAPRPEVAPPGKPMGPVGRAASRVGEALATPVDLGRHLLQSGDDAVQAGRGALGLSVAPRPASVPSISGTLARNRQLADAGQPIPEEGVRASTNYLTPSGLADPVLKGVGTAGLALGGVGGLAGSTAGSVAAQAGVDQLPIPDAYRPLAETVAGTAGGMVGAGAPLAFRPKPVPAAGPAPVSAPKPYVPEPTPILKPPAPAPAGGSTPTLHPPGQGPLPPPPAAGPGPVPQPTAPAAGGAAPPRTLVERFSPLSRLSRSLRGTPEDPAGFAGRNAARVLDYGVTPAVRAMTGTGPIRETLKGVEQLGRAIPKAFSGQPGRGWEAAGQVARGLGSFGAAGLYAAAPGLVAQTSSAQAGPPGPDGAPTLTPRTDVPSPVSVDQLNSVNAFNPLPKSQAALLGMGPSQAVKTVQTAVTDRGALATQLGTNAATSVNALAQAPSAAWKGTKAVVGSVFGDVAAGASAPWAGPPQALQSPAVRQQAQQITTAMPAETQAITQKLGPAAVPALAAGGAALAGILKSTNGNLDVVRQGVMTAGDPAHDSAKSMLGAAAGGGAAAGVPIAPTSPGTPTPPPAAPQSGLAGFWEGLGSDGRILVGLGLGAGVVGLLLNMFGDDTEDEYGRKGGPGFLARVLPLLGLGAAAWGAGGGGLPDLNNISATKLPSAEGLKGNWNRLSSAFAPKG